MKFEDLKMNNLKTKDLPVMMRIVKKLNLKQFLQETIDIIYNEEVPKEMLEELEQLEEEEKLKFVNDFREMKYIEVVTMLLNELIDGYDKIHDDIETLISNLYNLTTEEVQDLDLDITLQCIYNLKEQEQLINFFKTALK